MCLTFLFRNKQDFFVRLLSRRLANTPHRRLSFSPPAVVSAAPPPREKSPASETMWCLFLNRTRVNVAFLACLRASSFLCAQGRSRPPSFLPLLLAAVNVASPKPNQHKLQLDGPGFKFHTYEAAPHFGAWVPPGHSTATLPGGTSIQTHQAATHLDLPHRSIGRTVPPHRPLQLPERGSKHRPPHLGLSRRSSALPCSARFCCAQLQQCTYPPMAESLTIALSIHTHNAQACCPRKSTNQTSHKSPRPRHACC